MESLLTGVLIDTIFHSNLHVEEQQAKNETRALISGGGWLEKGKYLQSHNAANDDSTTPHLAWQLVVLCYCSMMKKKCRACCGMDRKSAGAGKELLSRKPAFKEK